MSLLFHHFCWEPQSLLRPYSTYKQGKPNKKLARSQETYSRGTNKWTGSGVEENKAMLISLLGSKITNHCHLCFVGKGFLQNSLKNNRAAVNTFMRTFAQA